MLYVLLTNCFNILSTQTIEEVGATIITHKKSYFKHHKIGRLKLESFFLDNKNKIKVRGPDTCFLDYIWYEVKGKRGFKTYTYEKLSDELVEYSSDYPFMSTQEIVDWIKACHKCALKLTEWWNSNTSLLFNLNYKFINGSLAFSLG